MTELPSEAFKSKEIDLDLNQYSIDRVKLVVLYILLFCKFGVLYSVTDLKLLSVNLQIRAVKPLY